MPSRSYSGIGKSGLTAIRLKLLGGLSFGLLLASILLSPNAEAAYPGTPPLIVSDGGTGITTATAHGILIGQGTAPFTVVSPVADSVVVWGAATADPTTAGTSATADSLLGWGAAASPPTPVSLGTTCLNALTYTTTTHAFSCANPTQYGIVVGGASGAAFGVVSAVADSVPVWGSATANPTTAGTSSTADSALGWGAAASTPAPISFGSTCLNAHTYSTTTHAFGCANPAQYNVVIGPASGAAFSVAAPSATTGVPLVSAGATSNPNFGTATVAGGGTGATTLTAHGVLLGEGTSAVVATTPAADSVPLWQSATVDPTVTAITNCTGGTNALNYATATHTFSCNTISASGTVPTTETLTGASPITIAAANLKTSIISMATPAASTINLPTAVQTAGWRQCVKDGTTNFLSFNATIKSPTAGTIDGTAGSTGILANMQHQELCFITDGSNWWVE